MKNLGLLLILASFFFTSAKSDNPWSDFNKQIQNIVAQATEQGRLIQENVHKVVIQGRNDGNLPGIQSNQEQILKTVELIENGTPPADLNSNTTSLSTNINGKIITVKSTIFSTGNDSEGAIHNVKSTYDESRKIDWSINSIVWDRSGWRKHFINDGGSQVVSTSGNAKIVINS